MSQEKKTYVTTEAAGYVVAGARVPADYGADPVRPQIGFELTLTDEEAQYELAQGTIVLKEKKSPARAAVNEP